MGRRANRRVEGGLAPSAAIVHRIIRASLLASAMLLFGAKLARAQVRVGRDSSTRLNRFGRDLVYGIGIGLLFAEVDQLRNEPPQWGKGWEGYRRRAASDVGEFVIQEGTTEALAAALQRPLDYERCPCRGAWNRVRWALAGSVTDLMPNGHHSIAVPRIVGAYAGSFAQASWRPAEGGYVRSAFVNGTVSLLIGAGINLFYEARR